MKPTQTPRIGLPEKLKTLPKNLGAAMTESIPQMLGFDLDGDVVQSRIGRLVVAYLEPDLLASTAVFLDVASDSRGEILALKEMVIALTEGLSDMWTRTVPSADVVAQIRRSLASLQLAEDGAL